MATNRFFFILDDADGTVDVYLIDEYDTYRDEIFTRKTGYELRAVKGVEPFEGIEEDIRRRFYSWLESGTRIPLYEDSGSASEVTEYASLGGFKPTKGED